MGGLSQWTEVRFTPLKKLSSAGLKRFFEMFQRKRRLKIGGGALSPAEAARSLLMTSR